uniref:Amino acid permease/ SLC12A domain-containing protein n=1 Tax=Bionectria ochroleuca TaxID=29856 RepID=A0A8H7TW43_BIOOC
MTVQHHDGIIPTEHDALLPRPLQPPAGDSEPGVPAQDDPFASGDVVTAEEHRSFQRGLEQRHLSMIGIAGAIGTGLFLGLGGAVQTGGPLGALLGYGVIGLVVCAVQFALGEVAALLPVTGSYVRHAEFLVDPAWGVALGYNLVYGNILSIPSEITAICVLFRFWWPDVNPTPIILVFILLTLAVGLARIHVFGEVEYLFAWLKVLLIVFLIVLGLLIALGAIPGTPALGFRYWRDPGPFVEHILPGPLGHFLGFWQALAGAVFSFAGVESIAMAAAETKDPRSAIPAACKRVFLRIFLFYMLAILVVGMLVASNDPRLANGPAGDAAQSPFVIAASAAGIPLIPSVVNAVVITSAWSASNQSLLSGSRVLYGLALKGQAPHVFLRTTSWGSPYACVLLFGAFMLLSFLSLSSGALVVFWWFVDLTAAGILVSLVVHTVQPHPPAERHALYTSRAALCMCVLILFTSGFSTFIKGHWDTSVFVSSYLDIPLVLSVFLIWRFWKNTKPIPLHKIPLLEVLDQIDESSE